MDNLEELDAATLEEKLKAADSYEDRAAIRKALREIKKKQGLEVGGNKKRGSSQYNRFAGRPADTKVLSQAFVPTHSPIPSTATPPPPVRTPTPPNAELEREKREKEEERKKREKEEREREDREREREEREREREEREREREKKEREREKEEEERQREREKREREREEREREREERRKQREKEREEREREAKEKQEKERERREKERQERERAREEREREREERERMREQAEKEKEGVEVPQDTGEEDEHEDKKEDWILVDKKAAEELESQAEEVMTTHEDIDSGSQRNRPLPSSSSSVKDETEFQKFKLRKTASGEGGRGSGGGSTKQAQVNTHDFGVKLKPRPLNEETPPAKSTPPKTSTPSWKASDTPPTTRKEGGAPRTLADFQKLANRSKPSDTPPKTTPSSDKKVLIRSYVNAALEVRPPISSDHALYQLCSRPSNLCKLINKSVRGTVDLRALTKTPPPSASPADKAEAMEENMMLVVESARSIGCSITDDMEQLLASGDKSTIDKLLIELIRSRVVHMPGMEDEPSSTFNDLAALMSKLGLSPQEEVDQGEEEEEEPLTWKEKDSQRLQDKITRDQDRQEKQSNVSSSTWREERNKTTPEIDLNRASLDADLSYEERAALRRAEREKKRREREAHATPK